MMMIIAATMIMLVVCHIRKLLAYDLIGWKDWCSLFRFWCKRIPGRMQVKLKVTSFSSVCEADFESYLQLNLLERGNMSKRELSVPRGLCWRLLPGFLLWTQAQHNFTFWESMVLFNTQWSYPSRSPSVRKNAEMGAGVLDQIGTTTMILLTVVKMIFQVCVCLWLHWTILWDWLSNRTLLQVFTDMRLIPVKLDFLPGRQQMANVPASFRV